MVVYAEAAQVRRTAWVKRQLAAVLAGLPAAATEGQRADAEAKAVAELEAVTAPKVWLPVEDCQAIAGATVAEVRALSWTEDQEAQALPPDRQIMRVLERGLLTLGGSETCAKEFLASPPAELVVPLYRAISDLTWGN